MVYYMPEGWWYKWLQIAEWKTAYLVTGTGQAYAISYGQILGYIEQHGGSRTYMDLAQWYSGSYDVRYFDSVMESLVSLGYLTFRDDVYRLS